MNIKRGYKVQGTRYKVQGTGFVFCPIFHIWAISQSFKKFIQNTEVIDDQTCDSSVFLGFFS